MEYNDDTSHVIESVVVTNAYTLHSLHNISLISVGYVVYVLYFKVEYMTSVHDVFHVHDGRSTAFSLFQADRTAGQKHMQV